MGVGEGGVLNQHPLDAGYGHPLAPVVIADHTRHGDVGAAIGDIDSIRPGIAASHTRYGDIAGRVDGDTHKALGRRTGVRGAITLNRSRARNGYVGLPAHPDHVSLSA